MNYITIHLRANKGPIGQNGLIGRNLNNSFQLAEAATLDCPTPASTTNFIDHIFPHLLVTPMTLHAHPPPSTPTPPPPPHPRGTCLCCPQHRRGVPMCVVARRPAPFVSNTHTRGGRQIYAGQTELNRPCGGKQSA